MFNKIKTQHLLLVAGFILALFVLIVKPALAAETILGEHVRIVEDTVDDVYATGDTITVEATIDGDLIAFGNRLTINGTVTGDVLFAGQVLIINGVVEDDVRLLGMVLAVENGGVIGGDLAAGLFSLEMKPGSFVGGDALFGAPQAVLGDIAGNVGGSSGDAVRIAGKIGGDADLTLGGGLPFDMSWLVNPELAAVSDLPQGVTFGRDGRISGQLNYTAPDEVTLTPDEVNGGVVFTPLESAGSDVEIGFIPPLVQRFFLGFFYGAGTNPLGWVVSNFILLFLAGLLCQRFVPVFMRDTLNNLRTRPATSFGMGLLGYLGYWFVALPLLILFFFALVVPLALIGAGGRLFDALVLIGFSTTIGFRFFARWIALIAVGFLFGEALYRRFRPLGQSFIWPLAGGLLIVALLLVIPVFGDILLGALFSITGLGAAMLTLRRAQKGKVSCSGVKG